MYKLPSSKKSLVVLALILTSLFTYSQTTVNYTIVFSSQWNESDHGPLPPNPHWSKLVGATHNSNVVFLNPGDLASQAIENIAELGNEEQLKIDVERAIVNGFADQFIDGNNLTTADGEIVITSLDVDLEFPYLTLVSMIAPSPDWIITVPNLPLFKNGQWEDFIVIDLYVFDAGTDNGHDYTSEDDDTNPQLPISSLQNISPFNNNKVGTMTITLNGTLGVGESLFSSVRIFPNPSSGFITLSNIQNLNLESLHVYSSTGQLVSTFSMENKEGQYQINLNELSAGLYFLELRDASGEKLQQKLVIK
ncbi:T9SS type A sorting domain-containing protein [Mangrovimonas aestuarii]|uniref:T9SS type A sorting domain-containing protein n=1 Tax=Mangrovimonas aestuarii TaxID=3018443 RepID=UPI00237A06C8|nr:spondin domain-containing protein [Mangrovimonas aestuarii]